MVPSIRAVLAKSQLFCDHTPAELIAVTDRLRHRISEFPRGTILAVEGAPCSHIGIILEGAVEIQKVMASGRATTIDRLEEGQIFGEALVFSRERSYPATITSLRRTVVMYVSGDEIIRLCREDAGFLRRFLGLLSGKILMLNRRVRDLSYASIRQKVAARILEMAEIQDAREIRLGVTRREMAEELGVPRPSLSRELARMRDDGLIDFARDRIRIVDPESLEDLLFS